MKFKRLLRFLVLAITLASIGAIVPAIPISAEGAMFLDPDFGPIGTEVMIAVTEVGTTSTTTAYIRFDSLTSTTNQIRIPLTNGEYEGTFEIPSGLSGGIHTIYVYRSATDNAEAEFNVIPRLTSIDPEEGQVGSTITIEGDGFVSTAPSIYAYWDEVRVTPVSGSTVNSDGELSNFKIAVPQSTRGEHIVRLEDRKNENFTTDDAIFTVESKFTLTPNTGSIGDTLTLTGTGFAGGTVSILFDNQTIKAITVPTTGANAGAFTTTIVVPATTAGAHTVTVQDTEEFEATFTVSQQFTLTPTTAIFVGENINISGNGFPINTFVVVTLDNVPVTITPVPSTSATGTFNVNFPVPAAAKGQHTIKVQIGTAAPATGTITIKEKLLSLGPTSGPGGTVVKVSGNGFAPGSASVIMDGSTTPVGIIVVEANGSFTDAPFTIPVGTPAGPHVIAIAGIVAPSFTLVPDPKISVTPTSGVYADVINITGTGFGNQKNITIVIDDTYSLSTAVSDAKGDFSSTFTVPNLPKGQHVIKASDGGEKIPTAQFTINQKFTVGGTTGKLGDKVSLLGTGFAANRQVTVTFGGLAVSTDPAAINTDQYGAFSGFVTIPAIPAGSYSISVTDGTNTATGSFATTLAASISLTTTNDLPGYVGNDITIKGDGFKASVPVNVTIDTAAANTATGTTNAQGSFQISFKAPGAPLLTKGAHTIKISDGITTREFPFIMEGNAPQAPLLASPAAASKPVQPVVFTWNSVIDPSGVTYEFQLSQDPTFNPAKLVLEVKNLTSATYTLPADQKLIAAGGKTPYQWRVRAIDGAGNAGPWSTANTFNIGFVWPNWMIHVWYGLGILVALILGLWLGRRMAYQSY